MLPVRAAGRPESLGHTSDPSILLAHTAAIHGRCPLAWMVRNPVGGFQFGSVLSALARRGVAEALREVVRLTAPSDFRSFDSN